MKTSSTEQTKPTTQIPQEPDAAPNSSIRALVPFRSDGVSPKDQARELLEDLAEVFSLVAMESPGLIAFRNKGTLQTLNCHQLRVVVAKRQVHSAIGDLGAYFELMYPSVPVTLEVTDARVFEA